MLRLDERQTDGVNILVYKMLLYYIEKGRTVRVIRGKPTKTVFCLFLWPICLCILSDYGSRLLYGCGWDNNLVFGLTISIIIQTVMCYLYNIVGDTYKEIITLV